MKYRIFIVALFYPLLLFSQSKISIQNKTLTLIQAIEIATDSSLASFKAKNVYLSGYWQFRTFKSERLPSLSLGMVPLEYNRNFVKRYDSQNDVDVYKSQQSLSSTANLSLTQNLDMTGGTFYLDTELDYLRNIGVTKQEQYSSVPFRVGYSQSLFGFNRFKWEKRIEPVHYEKVKKELLLNLEEIAEQTTEYFFDLALYKSLYEMAKQNVTNSDTLYLIGSERYKVGSISHSDLLTLKLDVINAKIEVKDAETNLKRSAFNLSSYMQFDAQTPLELIIPNQTLDVAIPLDDAIRLAKENNPTMPELKENILTAQQSLEKTEKEGRFSASVSASLGFNQIATELSKAYQKPLQQDMVSVNLNIPILDWGVSKGKINMAKKNLSAVNITYKQSEQAFEQEVLMAVNDYNVRQSQIQLEIEAKDIAEQAYEKAKQLFFIGKTDVNSVNVSLNNKIDAERNYVTALKSYWLSYYIIRKLTLYDFIGKKPISIEFEQIHGY